MENRDSNEKTPNFMGLTQVNTYAAFGYLAWFNSPKEFLASLLGAGVSNYVRHHRVLTGKRKVVEKSFLGQENLVQKKVVIATAIIHTARLWVFCFLSR